MREMSEAWRLKRTGTVASPLSDPAEAPRQGDEGAPEAWIVFEPAMLPAFDGLNVGDDVLVLTWLHLAQRDVLQVHPRSDPARPVQGVFSTRSPSRPNPIGLHRVRITAIETDRLGVSNLEAVDGTPVIDVKPVLGGIDER